MLEPSKNILYGWTMSDSELDESSERQRETSVALRIELAGVAEVLREFFNLLEQYAPTWYTAEHHNRAVGALRVLEASRQVGKNEELRGLKRRVDREPVRFEGQKFIEPQQHSLAGFTRQRIVESRRRIAPPSGVFL